MTDWVEPKQEDVMNDVAAWVARNPDAVAWILDALADACKDTAADRAHDWQDKRSAMAWARIADRLHEAHLFFEQTKPY